MYQQATTQAVPQQLAPSYGSTAPAQPQQHTTQQHTPLYQCCCAIHPDVKATHTCIICERNVCSECATQCNIDSAIGLLVMKSRSENYDDSNDGEGHQITIGDSSSDRTLEQTKCIECLTREENEWRESRKFYLRCCATSAVSAVCLAAAIALLTLLALLASLQEESGH